MTLPLQIINQVKQRGGRITMTARALLEILLSAATPLSPDELRLRLAEKKYRVNKTTVYRQLHALVARGVAQEVQFNDRSRRYELKALSSDHHHHLICLECARVEDINFADDIERQAKRIARTKRFKVLRHSLEFFGVCRACQKKSKRA